MSQAANDEDHVTGTGRARPLKGGSMGQQHWYILGACQSSGPTPDVPYQNRHFVQHFPW